MPCSRWVYIPIIAVVADESGGVFLKVSQLHRFAAFFCRAERNDRDEHILWYSHDWLPRQRFVPNEAEKDPMLLNGNRATIVSKSYFPQVLFNKRLNFINRLLYGPNM
jgi:hypothetical protein